MNLKNHPLMKGNKYYYNMLNAKDKKIYDTLLDGVCVKAPKIVIDTPDIPLKEIIQRLSYDNPLLFFFRTYRYINCGNKIEVEFKYLITVEEIESIISDVYNNVRYITAQVKHESAEAKAKFFHDFISKKITYNYEFPTYGYMCVGPLLYGSGVCEGISAAFKLLCDYNDIPCVTVEGTTKNENNPSHAWNKVKINGKLFCVDVTYDLGGKNKYFNIPPEKLNDRTETMAVII